MKREMLKSKLPHGAKALIAKNAGVSPTTIDRWLDGRNVERELEVLEAVNTYLEIVTRTEEQKERLSKNLQTL